jgi:hypothetical protein
MITRSIPLKLGNLQRGEQILRSKALEIIDDDQRLQLQLAAVESAMDLADVFRQFGTQDEDIKVTQLLAMRTFNAFAASLNLALSGYNQNSALILRDVLETVFLLDLLQHNRALITRWRTADRKGRMKEFSPVKVREALDTRDGSTSKKRAEFYEMFSELAGHPTMNSALMLRPEKSGDAVIGPFIEKTSLEATLSEMGRLAIQVGELLFVLIPSGWQHGLSSRVAFAGIKKTWMAKFYPKANSAAPSLSPPSSPSR